MTDEELRAADGFALAAFHVLASKANPILERLLKERGVADFKELTRAQAGEVLKASLMEAAVLNMPGLDLNALRRAVTAITDDTFTSAMGRLLAKRGEGHAAFDPAQGEDHAIVLAGWGVPVAPLDRRSGKIIGPVARNAGEAAKVFGRFKTAFVGYQPAAAPYHLMVTDCFNTMLLIINRHPGMAAFREALTRVGAPMPTGRAEPFKHAAIVAPKSPHDRVETFALEDPSPHSGSVMMTTGWLEDGEHMGVPQEWLPFPRRVITEALHRADLAAFLASDPADDKPPTVN